LSDWDALMAATKDAGGALAVFLIMSFVMVGAYFALQLLVAVVATKFSEAQASEEGSCTEAPREQFWAVRKKDYESKER
jgi:hypothetical protein